MRTSLCTRFDFKGVLRFCPPRCEPPALFCATTPQIPATKALCPPSSRALRLLNVLIEGTVQRSLRADIRITTFSIPSSSRSYPIIPVQALSKAAHYPDTHCRIPCRCHGGHISENNSVSLHVCSFEKRLACPARSCIRHFPVLLAYLDPWPIAVLRRLPSSALSCHTCSGRVIR